MAARDRYTLDLRCPKCGRTGEARVSEADHPYMRSPDFRVDSLPEGFAVTKEGPTAMETDISCTSCGEVAG